MAKVEVQMTGSLTGRVWMDGVEQDDVVAIRFEVDVRTQVPAAVIIERRVMVESLVVDGAVDVTVLDNDGSRKYENT